MQSFSELPLSPELLRAVTELGYEKPSPIQIATLPILLNAPTDFLGLAATGTGKTAAFALPLLQRLDLRKKITQALVMVPTRELALQVSGQIDLLGKYKGVKALPVYGGSGYKNQIDGMKRGAPIVVGTPGRLLDHIQRGTLKLGSIQNVILDEADEMISMGFKKDLDKILSSVPRASSQIWLFSATMGPNVRNVADRFLRSPQRVQINNKEVLSRTVEQIAFLTKEANKSEILCKIIESAEDFYGLVFCQTKSMVTTLTQTLNAKGYRVDCLHGDRDQGQRERTLKAFRERRIQVLVCTDVASRGLDVKDVTHVVNYSLPRELESYVHRIGRTARSGKSGVAISLVTPAQRELLGRIERRTQSRITIGQIPTRKELGQKKVKAIFESFKNQPFAHRAAELLDSSWREALSAMTAEDIAARFLVMTYPDLFNDRQGIKA